MTTSSASVHLVGDPCGRSGIYTFYKTFGFQKQGESYRSQCIGSFFFVRISAKEDPCIGELQLLWDDGKRRLASVRLYFLPEQTPDGRQPHHGEVSNGLIDSWILYKFSPGVIKEPNPLCTETAFDGGGILVCAKHKYWRLYGPPHHQELLLDRNQHEVLAASERVVMRIEDLVQWITDDVQWDHGLVVSGKESEEPKDVKEEIIISDIIDKGVPEGVSPKKYPHVLVLSYPNYCRHRAMLRRLGNQLDSWANNAVALALGFIAVSGGKTHILFCRDTFQHDGLLLHDLNCDHLAPILKNKPRKKKNKIKRETSPDAESNTSDDNKDDSSKRKITSSNGVNATLHTDEQTFLQKLFKFMKDRKTPILRVPHLGFKQIDLYLFFKKAQKFGGYDQITHKKSWKHIYDAMGGDPGSTSAATCTRKHYERLLLPFERHLKSEAEKIAKIKIKDEANCSEPKEDLIFMKDGSALTNEENSVECIKSESMKSCEEVKNEEENNDTVRSDDNCQSDESALKIKLEKLSPQGQGQTKELWQQKPSSPKKARQQKPSKANASSENGRRIAALPLAHDGMKPNFPEEKTSNSVSPQGNLHTASVGINAAMPLPASTVSLMLDQTNHSPEYSSSQSKADIFRSLMSTCTKEFYGNSFTEKSQSEYPLSMSCPLPKSSSSGIPDVMSNNCTKVSNRRNSTTAKNTELKTVHNAYVTQDRNMETSCETSHKNLPLNKPYTAELREGLINPNMPELLSDTTSKKCSVNEKDENFTSTAPFSAPETDGQETSVPHRRPSVILHTEQIRSPPHPTQNWGTGDVQTKVPQVMELPVYFPSCTEVQSLQALHRKLTESRRPKMSAHQSYNQLPNKALNAAHSASTSKSRLSSSLNSLKAKEIFNKSSTLSSLMLQNPEMMKKEMYTRVNDILLNKKMQRLSERTTTNTHGHQRLHKSSVHTSASHFLQRTMLSSKTSQRHSNSHRNSKSTYHEQNRLKHSIPPVISSPFISSLSKSAHSTYKPSPYINFPSTPIDFSNTTNSDEILDLSTKKFKSESSCVESYKTDPEHQDECLDLSIKKKVPSPDTSGLPSGIENITPPPPLTGDECPVPPPVTFDYFNPLSSSRFYAELVSDKEIGESFRQSSQQNKLALDMLTATSSASFMSAKSSHDLYTSLSACQPSKELNSSVSTIATASGSHVSPFVAAHLNPHLWPSTAPPQSRSAADVPSSSTHKELNIPKKLPSSQVFPPQFYPHLYNDRQYCTSLNK